MTGGLIGEWKTTSFKMLATSPIYKGKGTESSTAASIAAATVTAPAIPRGTLRFRFLYWALLGRATRSSGARAGTRSPAGPATSPEPAAF